MAKVIKKTGIKNGKGKNIRFSDTSHKLLSIFCDRKGYKLGSYCEIASLEKMRIESLDSI